jgi:hypothetical protein
MSTRTYQTLVRSFAAELELLGLWQWSVFVLLHLPGYVPVYETDEANEAVMAASDEVDQYVTTANGFMSQRGMRTNTEIAPLKRIFRCSLKHRDDLEFYFGGSVTRWTL